MPRVLRVGLAALKIARLALSTQMSIARRTSASVAFSDASSSQRPSSLLMNEVTMLLATSPALAKRPCRRQGEQPGALVHRHRILVVAARAPVSVALKNSRIMGARGGAALDQSAALCLGSVRETSRFPPRHAARRRARSRRRCAGRAACPAPGRCSASASGRSGRSAHVRGRPAGDLPHQFAVAARLVRQPRRSWYSSTPSVRSERPSTDRPAICSGDM